MVRTAFNGAFAVYRSIDPFFAVDDSDRVQSQYDGDDLRCDPRYVSDGAAFDVGIIFGHVADIHHHPCDTRALFREACFRKQVWKNVSQCRGRTECLLDTRHHVESVFAFLDSQLRVVFDPHQRAEIFVFDDHITVDHHHFPGIPWQYFRYSKPSHEYPVVGLVLYGPLRHLVFLLPSLPKKQTQESRRVSGSRQFHLMNHAFSRSFYRRAFVSQ